MNIHKLSTAGATPVLSSDVHLLNAIDKLDGALSLLEVSVLATRAIDDDTVANLEEPLRRLIADLCDIRQDIDAAREVA